MSAAPVTRLEPRHTIEDAQRIILALRAIAGARPVDLVAHVVPAGRAMAWIEGLAFAIEHGVYPPDQDLHATDRWALLAIHSAATDERAAAIVEQARTDYGDPCDVVLLALDAGLGQPFVLGMSERYAQR